MKINSNQCGRATWHGSPKKGNQLALPALPCPSNREQSPLVVGRNSYWCWLGLSSLDSLLLQYRAACSPREPLSASPTFRPTPWPLFQFLLIQLHSVPLLTQGINRSHKFWTQSPNTDRWLLQLIPPIPVTASSLAQLGQFLKLKMPTPFLDSFASLNMLATQPALLSIQASFHIIIIPWFSKKEVQSPPQSSPTPPSASCSQRSSPWIIFWPPLWLSPSPDAESRPYPLRLQCLCFF